MQDFEKLASFYMGRVHDADTGETTPEPLLYDAKDLTTHAICVGMTGSGKTGLCVGLLEEAAIDGIPSIVIDPKGDMGNLMLTFPKLRGADFAPWVDPGEAARKAKTPIEFAEGTAKVWKDGLKSWGQGPERIQRFRDAADVRIYTPGSSTGISLTILKSFNAPSQEVIDDAEAFADRVQAAVSGILALVGVDADPVQSRDFILLSNILTHAWREGRDISLPDLIREIQEPPFTKLGVLDLESFFPSKSRFGLAMKLNNLLASPGFQAWLEGEPLDIQNLLYGESGKPRISILSISHLSDEERMFFVTLLLNEVISWMRAQSGTSSLRAILYMDEIFGYFPPSKEPPSKKPMLLLLKQARAFGLGVVLATQNPVDLDYKGLSNTGTWFLGRLQTERDKLRVLDGLEGAMTGNGKQFDRSQMDNILSGLGKRVFVLNNVHEDGPVLFQTRWVLSYLRGPLTREHIQTLTKEHREESKAVLAEAAIPTRAATAPQPKEKEKAQEKKPVLPTGIQQRFLSPSAEIDEDGAWLMRPSLHLEAKLHFANRTAKVDEWRTFQVVMPLDEESDVDWDEAEFIDSEREPKSTKRAPRDPMSFAELPAAASRKSSYTSWKADLKRWLYENRELLLWKNAALKFISEPGESERDFNARLAQAAREKRDIELEKLRAKYETKFDRIQEKIRKAKEKVGKEEEQVSQKKKDSLIHLGTTLIGALFGRKSTRGAGSTIRSATRVSKEKADVERAERDLEAARAARQELHDELAELLSESEDKWHPSNLEIDEVIVRPRKSDINITQPDLLWLPWAVDADGEAEQGFELEG